MKSLIFTALCISLTTILIAQKNLATQVDVIKCTGFAISKPLSELVEAGNFDDLELEDKKEVDKRIHNPPAVKNAAQPVNDVAAQNYNGAKQMMPTLANWQGLSGSGYPPDPSGAASPTHYFQAVNTQYRIYTKTGAAVTNGGPFNLSVLWAGSTNDGDPIVMYDKYASRWFMSQFNGNDRLLVAVSTSTNPLGTYFTYTFVPNSGQFPDYPKYSIWSDGYYFSTNIGSPFKVGAIDRTKILAGNPSATMISMNLPSTPNAGFFAPLPADADGTLPPNGTPCPLFAHVDDTWGVVADQLRIFNVTLNWTTPASSSVVLNQTLAPTAFNVSFDQNWDDVPQPGTTQKLDAINGVLMYRAQYRRWTGYNSVVLNHAVIVNATTKQVGVRWYELRQNTTTNVWSIYQQGTYAPGLHSRWLGSISMDDNGSIGLAYALSSGTVSPSIRYTGRNASDPLGTMTFSETIAISGSGAQTGGINRFGDYSHTSLDPDGITFWHTGEYIFGGAVRTRIFSFQIPLLTTGMNDISSKTDLIIFQNGNLINVKGVELPNNSDTQIDLFDINGKEISTQTIKPTNNTLEASVNTSGLSTGSYLVRIGNEQYQKIKKIIIN